MDNKKFLSICVISYNRPESLKRLLESIDVKKYQDEIEIVVCEDNAPRRSEVRAVAEKFKEETVYGFNYVENQVNLGFSKNWREAAHQAQGEYLLYMGDDDIFVSGALDPYISWLHQHNELGYVLRTYQTLNADGTVVINRYYNDEKFHKAGIDGYVDFFLKSNFMSGYTVKRAYTFDFEDDAIDYTLYYQMYLQGEICLRYPSAYNPTPITVYVGDGVSMFGVNECEKDYFKPGVDPASDAYNVKKTFAVCEFIDKKNGINSTPLIKQQFAKYSSYPTMFRCRLAGRKELKKCKNILIELGANNSKLFNIYYYALLILGPKVCTFGINRLKQILGSRPDFK